MRSVFYIIQKEFLQVFRNRRMLPIIFVVPIVQLLILVNATTLEMKEIKMTVVDLDLSSASRQMTSRFTGSPFFRVQHATFSMDQAAGLMQEGRTDLVLVIPKGFEKSLAREGHVSVQLVVNAINGAAAGLVNAYTTSIILGYNRDILAEWVSPALLGQFRAIGTEPRYWFNPELNYTTYMVPGILVLLVTIIGLLLSGMNIVREKEIGTIEQINVTPVRKVQFIAGTLIPYWIIGLFELAFGLTLGKLIFDIPIVGSLGLIFGAAAIYLFVILGFGLLISTMANTQQQAMLVSFFFIMVFILMSGLFTATESMPQWAQWLNRLNPIAYFIRIMRMVMLKGSGFYDVRTELASLAVYGVLILSLAVRRYRKVS
jgi:ABC-2 type transport system permease protein